MKRLKWRDSELNRMAANHTLGAIEQLRPTDFIKARGNPLGFSSGLWIWFPDTNQHQPISTNINQHQPWFLDCINTITISMRGLANYLRLVMIQPMLNVYLLNYTNYTDINTISILWREIPLKQPWPRWLMPWHSLDCRRVDPWLGQNFL